MPWNPITAAQDWVDLGGHITPGICEVVGANTPRRWDKRESYGFSGATIVYHGLDLSAFSLKLRLYSVDDWNDWYAFKVFIEKPLTFQRQGPLDITHPITAAAGIRSVVVEDVIAPQQTNDGEWTVEIKLIEWRPFRLSLAKPDGSQAAPVDPALQSARDKAAARIAAKRQVADHLATDPQP